MGFIDQFSNALLKQMESSFNEGKKSIESWIEKAQGRAAQDYAAGDITTTLKEGNPSAAAFMKFQAFTTAAVQDQRIRTRIQAALSGNIKRGEGERDFRKVIDSEFDKAGLTRLHPHQVENIYITNTSLAYGAGQMQKMVEVSGDFPYWKYSATMDSKTRPSHAALHGKIFRNGDFKYWPPLGFRCRCTAIPLTARQAAAQGGLSTPPAEGYEAGLTNAGFLGNKNEKYMKWLAKEYDKADKEARGYIDKAIDELKTEILTLKTEAVKQLAPGKTVRAGKLANIGAGDIRFVINGKAVEISGFKLTDRFKVVKKYTRNKVVYIVLEQIKSPAK